jgi:acyl carrier protein
MGTMMKPSISSKKAFRIIDQILCELLDIDEESLHDGLSFVEDLNVDSILAMEVIATIETEFGMEIEPESLMEIETLGDLYRIVETYMNLN